MPSPESLFIPGESVAALEALSDMVQVTPEQYTEQSLRLGMYLAHFALCGQTSDKEELPTVLFEQPCGSFSEYFISFQQPSRKAVNSSAFSAELSPHEEGAEPVLIHVRRGLLAAANDIAQLLGTDCKAFVSASFTYRWHWSIARQANRQILIDDKNLPDSYLLVEKDIWLED